MYLKIFAASAKDLHIFTETSDFWRFQCKDICGVSREETNDLCFASGDRKTSEFIRNFDR